MVGVWSLKVPGLLSASQLGEQVSSGVALPKYIVHLKEFEIVNESFDNMVVLELDYFLGLVSVGNLSLDKLRVYVAS